MYVSKSCVIDHYLFFPNNESYGVTKVYDIDGIFSWCAHIDIY